MWHLHERTTGGGLAGTGLADETERLSREYVDADIGDGVDLETGIADRKLDHDVLGPKERSLWVAEVSGTAAGPQDSSDGVVERGAGTPTGVPAAVFRASASLLCALPMGKKQR